MVCWVSGPHPRLGRVRRPGGFVGREHADAVPGPSVRQVEIDPATGAAERRSGKLHAPRFLELLTLLAVGAEFPVNGFTGCVDGYSVARAKVSENHAPVEGADQMAIP